LGKVSYAEIHNEDWADGRITRSGQGVIRIEYLYSYQYIIGNPQRSVKRSDTFPMIDINGIDRNCFVTVQGFKVQRFRVHGKSEPIILAIQTGYTVSILQ
jgi:hypothetical protein